MGCLLFNFALSSNSYVDSLNGVCSGINMDLGSELSAKKKKKQVPPLMFMPRFVMKNKCLFLLSCRPLNVQPILCIFWFCFEVSDKETLRGVKLYTG